MNVVIAKTKAHYNSILTPLCAIVLIVVITDYRSSQYSQKLQSIYIRLALTLKSPLKHLPLTPTKMGCWNTVVASI